MASSAAPNLYFTLVSQYGEDDAIKLLQKIHARDCAILEIFGNTGANGWHERS